MYDIKMSKKDRVLNMVNEKEYKGMTVKQLAVIFSVDNSNLKSFEKDIVKLQKEGHIYIDNSKRIQKNGKDNIFVCRYKSKAFSFGFANIIISSDFAIDKIYIPREDSLNAFDLDLVLVKIKKEATNENSAEGEILQIIQRTASDIIGTYIESANFGFVNPVNESISDIYIPIRNSLNAKEGSLVETRIISYPTKDRKAEGKVIQVLGDKNTKLIEELAIFSEKKVSQEFPKEVEDFAKEVAHIKESDLQKRVDKRGENIYTIDSETAKDLDDAVSVKKVGEDYLLSVHIADVSKYVVEDSVLDNEAIKRGTSIYTPAIVVPMLPKILSNGICSLNENEDRLTLSIDVLVDKEGSTKESKIYKSIIRSKKKLTYEKTEKVLDGIEIEEYNNCKDDILLMYELGQILRENREKLGSINFDIPESNIILNEDFEVISIEPYNTGKSNKIIEEFMLLANKTIAETFFNLDAPFIYRIHEKPDIQKLKDTNEVLHLLGVSIKGINKVHPKQISDILNSFENDAHKKMVVSNILLRSLKVAKYSNKCDGHFGLNFEYYTHFTSPIRRYPDLFIHRVISKYIESSYTLEISEIEDLERKASKYAMTSTDCEKLATEIERDLDDLYKAKYMKQNVGKTYTGVISSITKFGIYVKLPNTVQGLVLLSNIEDDFYEYDEKYAKLVGKRTNKTYQIGDTLFVLVSRVDINTRQIDFVIKGE